MNHRHASLLAVLTLASCVDGQLTGPPASSTDDTGLATAPGIDAEVRESDGPDAAAPTDASDASDAADARPESDASIDAVSDASGDASGDATAKGGVSTLAPEPSKYDGPLVITAGGTYSGAWKSADPATPAVTIKTSEPVTIDGCFVRTAGKAFVDGAGGIRVTIRNCQVRPEPSPDGKPHARFVSFANARSVRIENNYWERMNGIQLYRWSGDGSAADTLKILRNLVHNVWLEEGEMSNFIGMNTLTGLRDAEIAWNQVLNDPNESGVEDNINFWNTSGRSDSPFRLHDNFVRGAYPLPADGATFTGTGMTTDGDTKDPALATGWLEAYDNQFVSTCNAAMNLAAGHDVHYRHNRMITSGLMADGKPLNGTYAATAIWDAYHVGPSIFHDDSVTENVIAYVKPGYHVPYADRQDLSTGACTGCSGNTSLPNPVTLDLEKAEATLFLDKLVAGGVVVGPM